MRDVADLSACISPLPESSQGYSTLYHYARFSAAQNILSGQRFWATAPDCTIDQTELISAYPVVTAVARALRKKVTATPRWVLNAFLAIYPQCMDSAMKTVYLTCFSMARDDKTLWRQFGDDSRGICLGIRLLNEASPDSEGILSRLWQVEYSESSLRDSVARSFSQLCSKLAGADFSRSNIECGVSTLRFVAAAASILERKLNVETSRSFVS
jgi:hypothetical protein